MLRRIILGAVCALDGYVYYCPFCSFTCDTDTGMGAHIAAEHPMGK